MDSEYLSLNCHSTAVTDFTSKLSLSKWNIFCGCHCSIKRKLLCQIRAGLNEEKEIITGLNEILHPEL